MSKVGPIGRTTKAAKPTLSKFSGKAGGSGGMKAGMGNLPMNPKPTASKFSGKASGRDVNLNGKADAKPTSSRFPGGK